MSEEDKDRASVAAWWVLACGVLSVTAVPVVAGIPGVVIGWRESKRIQEGKAPVGGEWPVKIGFWLSVVSLTLAVIGGAVLLSFGMIAGAYVPVMV